MSDNVQTVDFRKKEDIEAASEKVLASARAATAAQFIDSSLDVESKVPEMRPGEEFVDDMNASEIDMFRQMSGIAVQIKKDLDTYHEQVEKNLTALLEDDPEKISAFIIKKALYEDVDRNLVNRLCRNQKLFELLKSTMFWRIQERTQMFDFVLNVRKGFKVVKTSPVHITQVDEAMHRLKKLHTLQELEKSNHPMKHIIKQMIEQQWDL